MTEGYEGGNAFYEQGIDVLSPIAQEGRADTQVYRQALGLGTPEEATAAQDRYFSDPAQQRLLDQKSNALLRQLNARGSAYNARAPLAGARVATENYNNWLDRVGALGGRGDNALMKTADIRLGQGDMRYGFGATMAGNNINYGNARAQASTIGVNNLLGAIGAASKAYGAFSNPAGFLPK